MKMKTESEVMWRPKLGNKTQMDEFRCHVNKKFDLKLESYQELWQWSVDQYSEFWKEFWSFSRLMHSKTFDNVVDTEAPMPNVPEWFSGSRLNYGENLLQGNDDDIAIYAAGEQRKTEMVTYGELRRSVSVLSSALRNKGVQVGDRVVGYIPNCRLAVEAMLATASLGAIWSSTSPDFGVSGVLDRFSQIKPKVIFSVEAVIYNNRVHNHLEKLQRVIEGFQK